VNYPSGDPNRPMTPEAKLADRRWRYLNSWWIFVPVVSCGFLCWLGFMIAAIRTGKRSYWVHTGTYALMFALFFVLVTLDHGRSGALSTIAVLPFLGCTLGATVHAAVLNRDYLRTIAAKGAWYSQPIGPPHSEPALPPPPPPVLGVSQADYYGPETPSVVAPAPATERVDVNSAGTDLLAGVLAGDRALAGHIIAIRDARGGYRDLDDLVSAANLQPHQLVRIRDRLSFGGAGRAEPPAAGRILDY
jgi:helix-hairpin-helix protein